jgi:hypothetical protein
MLDVSEIRNKKSKSFYDALSGTISFFYYVSPLGYLLENEKHNLAIEIFRAI